VSFLRPIAAAMCSAVSPFCIKSKDRKMLRNALVKSKNLVLIRDPAFGADQDPSDSGVTVTSTCVQRSVSVLKFQQLNYAFN